MTPEPAESRRRFRRRRNRRPRSERRRAVFLIPNLITSASLMLGFWSMVQSIGGQFGWAAGAIVAAGICDMLDGRIARATRSTSKFGVEYDSLADVISFGVAPAMMFYMWALQPLGPRGWVFASLFVICAALRLARFNVQQNVEERVYYQGMPTTLAGGLVGSMLWFVQWLELGTPLPRPAGIAVGCGFVTLALLMVSTVPYPSWKAIHVTGRQAFATLVVTVLVVVLILLYREPAFFAVSCVYLLTGPALGLWQHWHPVPTRNPTPVTEQTEGG
jgi:CDP-diacylglycerol--serine O-phosphatidyltransferase